MHYPLLAIAGALGVNLLGFSTHFLRAIILVRPLEALTLVVSLLCAMAAATLLTATILTHFVTVHWLKFPERSRPTYRFYP